jgi:hypothetical protein
MKKQLLFFALLSSLLLRAQTEKLQNIRQELVSFNGANYNGIVADVDAPPDMVEGILKERFAKQGVKPKEINGFLVFRKVILKALDSTRPMDAFFKVEKKSRKEKDISTISLIPANPGDIGDEKVKSGTPSTVVTAAAISGGILAGLNPDIDLKVFEKNLGDKQAEINKGEKKLKDLQEDQANYEKKIKGLQEDLEKNKKDQEFQQANLERLRKDLQDLNAKKPKG